ncbi:MAG: hypothetical protein FJ276_10990 [Planctomycetes bacterium]|nr:hypothetical protein [Planctomycetota bacterium]
MTECLGPNNDRRSRQQYDLDNPRHFGLARDTLRRLLDRHDVDGRVVVLRQGRRWRNDIFRARS